MHVKIHEVNKDSYQGYSNMASEWKVTVKYDVIAIDFG